jgi:hypothetical protein
MQEVENMQVQNDDSHMRLRSELQRIIDALEAQRLYQAAAYASMAVDCLDRLRPGRDVLRPPI